MNDKHLQALSRAVRLAVINADSYLDDGAMLTLGAKIIRIVGSIQIEDERDARDEANGKHS
jgi:hypothetical protein